MFQKAKRAKAKLRMGLTGPSGSGKTYSALLLAKGMGGRVAVIDTEHSSAALYADIMDFDTLSLVPPYSPERYIDAITAAEDYGYDVLIIDSITHEWNGSGGCLQILDRLIKASEGKLNSYTGWGRVTPRHNAFIDKILQSRIHIIVTMRSKTDFTLSTDEKGVKKNVPIKLGMAPIQREGFEYEMTTVLDITHDGHFATVSKDRTRIFEGDPERITEDTGKKIMQWLNEGELNAPRESEELTQILELIQNADTLDDLESLVPEAQKLPNAAEKIRARAVFAAKKFELKNAT